MAQRLNSRRPVFFLCVLCALDLCVELYYFTFAVNGFLEMNFSRVGVLNAEGRDAKVAEFLNEQNAEGRYALERNMVGRSACLVLERWLSASIAEDRPLSLRTLRLGPLR